MAKKEIKAVVKLQIPAGSAAPTPPVGPALGQHGVNIMEICKQFNEKTKNEEPGMIIPAVVTIYKDRSFAFITRIPPVSVLLKKAAGIAKASGTPNREPAGTVTEAQVEEIAKTKLQDLNTDDVAEAVKIVRGTARSMGVQVVKQ